MRGYGWRHAHQIEPGDELHAEDGRWLAVEAVEGNGPAEPVFNVCVEEYHTYFVGDAKWGFAVWAHNARGYQVDKSVRSGAVAQAWSQEAKMVRRTGNGTLNWTPKQKMQLLGTGRVTGYVGHHINSVNNSPLFAGLPENIQFVTFRQHYRIHNNGRFRIPVYGDMLSR